MTDNTENRIQYKAIADRLVERGIGKSFGDFGVWRYRVQDSDLLSDKEFCHDWRVAGACMERAVKDGYLLTQFDDGQIGWYYPGTSEKWFADINESLPLAIILAYLEATDGA